MSAVVTVRQVADLVGGDIVRGAEDTTIARVMPVDLADEQSITFVTKPKYAKLLAATRAAAVLADRKLLDTTGLPDRLVLIAVPSPYVAFARVAQHLAARIPRPEGVHASAVVEADATVGEGASIGPFVYVGPGARIGAGAVLYPGVHVESGASVGPGSVLYNHVVIRHDCHVGAQCILHPGVVVGSDGFGFAPESRDGGYPCHVKIPQVGNVVIEDDVEIGANTCVDRGTLGTTRIGEGTKIDNLVQIAHNVTIGPRCIIVAQAGIAGSSKLEEGVTLAAQSGISGHITVGAGSMVYGQSGVAHDLPAGSKVGGSPAIAVGDYFRNSVRIQKLGTLASRVKTLEDKSNS